jgi:hypothetical protein
VSNKIANNAGFFARNTLSPPDWARQVNQAFRASLAFSVVLRLWKYNTQEQVKSQKYKGFVIDYFISFLVGQATTLPVFLFIIICVFLCGSSHSATHSTALRAKG